MGSSAYDAWGPHPDLAQRLCLPSPSLCPDLSICRILAALLSHPPSIPHRGLWVGFPIALYSKPVPHTLVRFLPSPRARDNQPSPE